MRISTFFWGLFFLPHFFLAQTAEEIGPPSYIRSIIFTAGDAEFSGTPIIQKRNGLRLEFDDIIGDEADYYYSIEHYNYDWTPSQLVKSEYLEGFDDVRINDYENSYNTLQLYSHYRLTIPNSRTTAITKTGNYMLHLFNEERELIFSRKFMVYKPMAKVDVAVARPREVSSIATQQVVNFRVHSEDLILKNPKENVRAVVLQNNNPKTGIYNIEPQYTVGNDLIYNYDRLTAFWGGNEYLSFDSKDLRSATSSIEHIEVKDLYHHFLFVDRTRSNLPYTFNPDINGNFVIRTSQGDDKNIEAEYVWTHFALETSKDLEGGELHLYGNFNNYTLDNSTRLTYNANTQLFETARLFKQGYYNYKYVLLRENGMLDEGFISGNFEQTENQYTVLIYYRPPGARYDRIIGVGTANSAELTN